MIPQAGSAYAYSYATLGEFVAWIIGWDLILEYAVGNIAVAIAWSGYFTSLLSGFGITPARLADARLSHRAAQLESRRARPARDRAAHRRRARPAQRAGRARRAGHHVAALPAACARARGPTRHGDRQARRAGAVRRCWAPGTSIRPTIGRSRRTAGRAFTRAPRSCSSPTSGSTRSRRRPKRRAIRSATCRSAFSAACHLHRHLRHRRHRGDRARAVRSSCARPIRWRARWSSPGLPIASVIVAFGAVVSLTAVLLVFQYGQPRIFFCDGA